ncbi:MAG: hypothetical protein M3Q13_01450, partial [Pseudomonadota bacterium]|nr:hypothetical protein [Pseudomonadota bacterium]
SYNFVEGGYVATNLDNDNDEIDADGWGVNGSVALHPNFHLFGGFSGQQTDDFGSSARAWKPTSTSGAPVSATTSRSGRKSTRRTCGL